MRRRRRRRRRRRWRRRRRRRSRRKWIEGERERGGGGGGGGVGVGGVYRRRGRSRRSRDVELYRLTQRLWEVKSQVVIIRVPSIPAGGGVDTITNTSTTSPPEGPLKPKLFSNHPMHSRMTNNVIKLVFKRCN